MRMPVMSGYEASQYIKSHLQGQATYIIALTASTFEDERAMVLSAGCDDFVRKPFPEAVLFDKMAQYLGVRYIYQENTLSETIPVHQESDLPLKPVSLQVMPYEWLIQLEEAAVQLDKEAIAELLQEIPEEQTILTQTLQNKVDDFDFEEILNLVQETIKLT